MAKMPHLRASITEAELQSVQEEYREAYLDYEDNGSLTLNKRIAQFICEKLTEIEQLEKERDGEIKKRDTDLITAKAARNSETVDAQLKAALIAAGAAPTLIPGAIALLREQHTFEVEDGYDGQPVIAAQTEAGLHSVDVLVENFLDSDEGAAFRPKRPQPNDGYFTSLVAGLKQRR